ncbi:MULTISPECIES: grasp-with-spasm system SPASM domain peptide maturase [Flavobacterium]|uniref:4Fe4S-binding SPASM domain-containing protein n=1 Tax=Flavobacterium hankyongi TaxID=1176532 RepID=A0ABP8ZLK2_9FLAO|nr:grasp-with-spasm system SPASM domain peptide maturase [Flavobacterium sp. N1846]
MNSGKYFKVFANCIFVYGYNRSLIIDSQRNHFTIIPNEMYDMINQFQSKKSIEDVVSSYGHENLDVVNEYIDFLIENEFGFVTNEDEFDLFPKMNTDFEIASHITNCIVEISEVNLFNIDKIISDLDFLQCKNVQFISYETIDLKTLKDLLVKANNSNFRSIELVLKYSDEILSFINKIDDINFRVTQLTLHSSSPKREFEDLKASFNINLLEYELKNFKHCGIVDAKYFSDVNKYKILESLNHNSCLNKKVSINKKGEIKNCPSMTGSFGNINDITLKEAFNHSNFKEYWGVTKDKISVCKDCEFRHVCTDCRAYVENPNDMYSKPLKCGYNPYTNVWEEWSTNPLKEKAIAFYEMSDLIKR